MSQQLPQAANRLTAAVIGGSITAIAIWVLELLTAGPDGQGGIVPPAMVTVAMTNIVTLVVGAVYRRFPGFQPHDGQGGYAHPILLAILAVIVSITMAGCASDMRKPQTTYEALLVGNKYGEQVTLTVNDLRRNRIISTATHQTALDYLQDALDASRTGRVAYQAGNFSEAQSSLDRTEAILATVAALLAPHLPETPDNEAFVARYGGAQ